MLPTLLRHNAIDIESDDESSLLPTVQLAARPGGCTVIVVTETSLAMQPRLIRQALQRHFNYRWEYTLLAYPDIERLIGDDPCCMPTAVRAARMDQHASKLLVLTSEASAQQTLRSIRALEPSRKLRRAVATAEPLLQPPPNALLVCNDDWRLHSGTELPAALRKMCGRRSHVGTLSSCEAIAALSYGGSTAAPILNQIAAQHRNSGLRSLILVEAADEACRHDAARRFLPQASITMRMAKRAVRKAFPAIRNLRTAYAFVNDEGVTGLVESSA